jgi:signal transduction histidine kinase/CheY-like chemotaxis protein
MILRIFTLLFIAVGILNASYSYKKIVLASFPTQREADRTSKKIKAQLYADAQITALKKEHHFKLVSRASGKYFIISVEPFRDKKVLLKVLRAAKKIRKDAFVNRFVSDVDLFATIEKEKMTLRVPEKKITAEVTVIEKATVEKNSSKSVLDVKKVDPVVVQPTAIKTVPSTKIKQEAITSIPVVKKSNQTLFYVLILFLGILVLLLIYKLSQSKKRLKTIEKNNEYLHHMMKHKDVVFAKNIHELRTPIHGIIGMSHLLNESDTSRKYADSIEKITTSANRMLQLVNNLLDLSKLEAQKVEIEHIEFNLDDVLEDLSDNIGIEANKKGLSFLYKIENKLPKLYVGDPLRLSQILLNLCSNAIKFTTQGGVYLDIKQRFKNKDEIVLEFEVQDSGIGLSEAQEQNVFEIFSQSEKSTSRIYGGSGLGLAIAKELVELMGGEISYKQNLKSTGAIFCFTITLEIVNPDEKRVYRLPSKSMMYKRAIIVDKSEKSIEFLTQKLEYFHYDVIVMPSLVDVIKQELSFDLLLLDESLFQTNTVSYLDAIREADGAKIILVETLYKKMLNSKIHFRFDYRIIKPFTQQRVMDMVVDLYGKKPKTVQKRRLRDTIKEELMHLEPQKILLTEDNIINQKVILGLLKNTPIEVIVANNGLEALDRLREYHDIALILMDLSMPIMDGYSAAKNIKKMPKYDDVPIVALSANLMSDEVAKIAKVGMVEYLPKPFEMDKFYGLLLKYLA